MWCAWRKKSARTMKSCLYVLRRVHDSCIDAKLSKTERKIWEVRKTANGVRIHMILTETEFFSRADKFPGLVCTWLWRCRFSCHLWECHSCHWWIKNEELHNVGLFCSCGKGNDKKYALQKKLDDPKCWGLWNLTFDSCLSANAFEDEISLSKASSLLIRLLANDLWTYRWHSDPAFLLKSRLTASFFGVDTSHVDCTLIS